MNRRTLLSIVAAIPLSIVAQTAVDAYSLSRYDLRGSARSMSMGGAFGALGGDLSAINVNPGGIGVYRKSEVGLTLDIDMGSSKSHGAPMQFSRSGTDVFVNNVGYVGTANLGSEIMPTLSWGFSYNRAASFNRRFHGAQNMNGSLTNYIAGYTSKEGWDSNALSATDDNYFNINGAPWMSILAYNSYLINPQSYGSTSYSGLWADGKSNGEYEFDVEEKGHIDEYEISLGGNISDLVYWGIGFGITDIDYKQYVYYEEYMNDAIVPTVHPSTITTPEYVGASNGPVRTPEDVSYGLASARHISGSGFNFKVGAIIRPTQWLRLGLAVHTPTYYNITETNAASTDFYFGGGASQPNPKEPWVDTPADTRSWKLRTPWRLIASAAGVIGSKAIVSMDYEYRPYSSMTLLFADGDNYPEGNADIKDCFTSTSILRIGAEYRLNSMFSLRAGYAFESSPSTTQFSNSELQVYTSNPWDTGTTPSYTIDHSTNYITCGLGFHYKKFYADLAYVHKRQSSDFAPYTANEFTYAPLTTEVTNTNNNIVLSIGLKF